MMKKIVLLGGFLAAVSGICSAGPSEVLPTTDHVRSAAGDIAPATPQNKNDLKLRPQEIAFVPMDAKTRSTSNEIKDKDLDTIILGRSDGSDFKD